MPLTQRALLLSVVLASCAMLQTTQGRYSEQRADSESVDSELIEMLKKLRGRLNSEKVFCLVFLDWRNVDNAEEKSICYRAFINMHCE